MSGCIGTDKPQISILMAIYEPRMDWLREQLLSLDRQTYPNLKLYIRDDCSPTVSFDTIQSCVRDCIRAFPYEIRRNKKNLGSNGTFERLTREVDGTYFAYCDQDDIWLPEKLERLEQAIEASGSTMAYCDMAVIDGEGNRTAESLRELRSRLHYVQGEGQKEAYFFRNCTAGCSMLIQGEVAKKAVPFLKYTVCDQWLAVCAAGTGRVSFVEESLILYRQHGSNQTGVLYGVTDKASYLSCRLLPLGERIKGVQRFGGLSVSAAEFVNARLSGDLWKIWKYRAFSPWEATFEILMRLMPDWAVRQCLRRIR